MQNPDSFFLRSYFAPGNLNPLSPYLGGQEFYNSLFSTDRPNHLILATSEDVFDISSQLLKSRGIRAVNYNLFYPDLDIDSNQRANYASYFLGSVDQPYTPYIMISSSTNVIHLAYCRKFGMTIFSYKGFGMKEVPEFIHYEIGYDDLANIATRPIYVRQPADLKTDLRVGPIFLREKYENYLTTLSDKLSARFHSQVRWSSYHPAMERVGITVDKDPYLTKDFYRLNTFEAELLIPEDKFVLDKRRKFIVAGSGSGKSFWCRMNPDYAVDADKIFEWPNDGSRWWDDPERKKVIYDRNIEIMRNWLNAEQDSKIIFFADDMETFEPDAFVLIPDSQWKMQLANSRPGQPDASEFERIKNSQMDAMNRNKRTPVFTSFSLAVSHIYAQNRLRLPRRHRFSWNYYFLISKSNLPEFRIQTYLSVQTWIVKSITYSVSRLLNFDADDMEVPRRLAMIQTGCFPVPHKRIGGYLKWNGKPIALAVAGHMVNYVILSAFIPLDWERFFTHMEWNLELFSTRRKLTLAEKNHANRYELGEFNDLKSIYNLWHSLPEWLIGLRAGVIFSRYLGFKPDITELNKINDYIIALFTKYPKAVTESMVVRQARLDGYRDLDFVSAKELLALTAWSVPLGSL